MKYITERIIKLKPYTPGEQINDDDIIKLNTNENPFFFQEDFIEKIKSYDFKKLRLYPDPILLSLRKKIGNLLGISYKNIFIGNGSDEIIKLIPYLFIEDQSQKFAMFEITYSLYKVIGDTYNFSYIEIPNNKDLTISLEKALEEITTENVVLFFLPNPNSPTGEYIPLEKIEFFLKNFDGVLALDEAYIDFVYPPQKKSTELLKKYKNLIIIRTFSKSFSLAGIRLGYAIADEEIISYLLKIKDSYNINSLTQYIGELAIDHIDTIRKNTQIIIKEREKLKKELEKLNFKVFDSQGNFIFVSPRKSSAEYIYKNLKKKNILIRYFYEPPQLKSYLRITIGSEYENQKLIEALKDIL